MTPANMAHIHAAAFTMPRPWGEAEMALRLAEPLSIILTESTGFVIGRVVAGEAEILTLAVDPAARRRGTGKALVLAFLHDAGRKGAQTVFLEVAETNAAAQALYDICGFKVRGSRKDYYRDAAGRGVAALVMVLDF